MTQYTKEFREQAILLSDEIGVKKAAEQLGVVYSTLVDWRKRRNTIRKEKQNVSSEPLTEREKQLMKEIAELKEAVEKKQEQAIGKMHAIQSRSKNGSLEICSVLQ